MEIPATESFPNPLQWEKELLGLYISGHPLEQFRERLERSGVSISLIKNPPKDVPADPANKTKLPKPQKSQGGHWKDKRKPEIMIGGMIEELKEVITKNNEKMLFMRLADLTGTIEAVVFPKVLEQFKDVLAVDNCVVIKGMVSTRNDEKSILVDKVKILE